MDQRQVALVVADHERLRVVQPGAAGRRIARVPQRCASRQLPQRFVVERVGREPVGLADGRDAIRDRADAHGLLPPVLERVKAQERQLSRVVDAGDAYDSAHAGAVPRR